VLRKLTVAYLLKKSSALHGTRKFTVVFATTSDYLLKEYMNLPTYVNVNNVHELYVRVPMRWIFSIDLSFQPYYGIGVDSASNRNEYQEASWGRGG
jgi:hypothetical protein